MPVLMAATYNEDGSVNVMNAAWGTVQARGAFTVSIADAAHVVEADYFGMESGNKVSDKFENSGVIGRVVNVTADESVMVSDKVDMSLVNAIAFAPYTHGYYKVAERVGEAFKDSLQLKK